ACARDLELDVRALLDLRERELLALRRVDEVLRVAVHELDPRVGGLRARLVAGDVVVDRRELLAADRADRVRLPGPGGPVLLEQAREVADEVARLLLLEDEAVDVLRRMLQRRLREVDDREARLGELG